MSAGRAQRSVAWVDRWARTIATVVVLGFAAVGVCGGAVPSASWVVLAPLIVLTVAGSVATDAVEEGRMSRRTATVLVAVPLALAIAGALFLTLDPTTTLIGGSPWPSN